MKILNAIDRLEGFPEEAREGLGILLRVLSPITPHIAHYLWRDLGFGEDVMTARWPEPDPAALEQDEIDYVVQVNGKTRGNVRVAKSLDHPGIETAVKSLDVVKKHVGDKAVKRVIIVPGRLINVVV